MDYGSSPLGGYGIGVSTDQATDHVDAFHADRVDIHDAELLFHGHFARSGPDLILTGEDGHRLVVTSYFSSEKHPDLVAPNGAHLTGDLVDLLAGSPTHGQYAEAGKALPPEAIGKVEKAVGQVTLIHNGVSGPLHVGDPVYKTDVVQTGPNSSCGIAFPDGTALDLVNNTRMALNDYNYQGDSAQNGAVFSLVQGTFAFVAGKVAHTGEGMKINTPVATMGIRGTVGLFRSEPTVVNANLGHVWSVFLHEDIDGSHHLGRIALIDQDPTSPTFGEVFYLLDSSEYIAYLEPQGPGLAPHVRLEPITNSKVFDDRHFYDDLGQILNAFETGTVNPQSVPGTPGSGDNPASILTPLQLFEDGHGPLFNFAPLGPGSGGPLVLPPFPGSDIPPIPVQPGGNSPPNFPNGPTTNGPIPPQPPIPPSTHFIWNSAGPQSWSQAIANWNQGSAPNSPIDTVEIKSGTSNFDINSTITLAFLTVDPGATLNIKAGQLIVGGLDDEGTINVNSDPLFVINGQATVGSGHALTVDGTGNETDFNGLLLNHGVITASHGGTVSIDAGGTNDDKIQSIDGGIVKIIDSAVSNVGGTIEATGELSKVQLVNADIIGGTLSTDGCGIIEIVSADGADISKFDGTTDAVTIDGYVRIDASANLQLDGTIHNSGTIEVDFSGVFRTGDSRSHLIIDGQVTLDGGGTVVLDGSLDGIIGSASGGTLVNKDNTIVGAGFIGDGTDADLTLVNRGTVDADLNGQVLSIETGNAVTNDGLLEATNGGILHVFDDVTGSGSVKIFGDGTVVFAGAFHEDVAFAGTGTLELAHSVDGAYGGTITGFGGGDKLILDDVAFDTTGNEYAVWCNGVLSIYDNGTLQDQINVIGNYSKNSFAVVDDGGKIEVVLIGDEWIGPSPEDRSGKWVIGSNWTLGVPTSELNAIVDLPGRYTITTSGHQAANSLTITDQDATLTGSGTLTLGTLDNDGTIKAAHGKKLVINFDGTSDNFGTFEAAAGKLVLVGTTETLGGPQFTNGGLFIAKDGGKLTVEHVWLFNGTANADGETPAEIKSTGRGSVVKFTDGSELFNYGLVLASDHGWIKFDGGAVVNEIQPLAGPGEGLGEQEGIPGQIEAAGRGSVVSFGHGASLNNFGLVEASDHGKVSFRDGTLQNQNGGDIEAIRHGLIKIETANVTNGGEVRAADRGTIVVGATDWDNANGGLIEAAHDGSIVFNRHSRVDNEHGATIEADGCGAEIAFRHSDLHNSGLVEAEHDGTVLFDRSHVDNQRHGTIEAKGWDSWVAFEHADVQNHGHIDAQNGGVVQFECSSVDNGRRGTIEAKGFGSAVAFSGSKVDNWGSIAAAVGGAVLFEYSLISNAHAATIDADGCGSQVTFDHDWIANSGQMDAIQHGAVVFESSFVTNDRHGGIEADGRGATVDFEHSYVRNFGTIEAASGGTVSVECSAIDNCGGTIEAVGRDATINLDHAVIVGGTVETKFGGVIQTVAGTSTLDDVRIAHGSHVDVGGGTTLTLTDGTTMFGGRLDIERHGTLDIESRAGATLDGVHVNNDGDIEVDRPHERTTLTLENGTTIDGGKLSIGHYGEVDIEGGRHGGATFDDVNVVNDGTIRVDDSAPATLHLTDGTEIHGGSLSIGRHGTVEIESSKGATFDDLSVWNDGTITFGPTTEGGHGGGGPDLFIAGTVTLHGGGDLVLAGPDDSILGAKDGGELINDSNIIGAGHIGDGDGSLKLINESCGVIDANQHGETLAIDTGHQVIVNDGVLAASNQGTLLVESALNNSCGSIVACSGGTVDLQGLVLGGSATIDGGTLIYTAALGVDTTFANHTPGQTSTLVLHGTGLSFITDAISGFSYGDVIDLADIAYNSSTSFKLFGDFLTVYDGQHGPSITIQLEGDYNAGNFALSKDANGDTEVTFNSSPAITGEQTTSATSSATEPSRNGSEKVSGTVDGSISFDDRDAGDTHTASATPDGKNYVGTFHVDSPSESDGSGSVDWSFDFKNVTLAPGKTLTQSYDVTVADQHGATATQQVSVSIGGPGNDTFVFNPGVGADTIVNFSAQNDHIDLEHFANIQNYQELAAAVTADAHGDAVIELGHNDSITVAGLSENALKASLQHLVHLA
jgi:FecR protein